jgi:hypothetical protein
MVFLNGLQIDALQRLGDSDDISSMALRREDSLGNVMDHNNGILVAYVLWHDGDREAFGISETGATTVWHEKESALGESSWPGVVSR